MDSTSLFSTNSKVESEPKTSSSSSLVSNSQVLTSVTPPTSKNSISNVSFEKTSDSGDYLSGFGTFFTGLMDTPFTTFLIIFIVLLLLGFNIFLYFSKGTEEIFKFTNPAVNKLSEVFFEITSSVLKLFGNISKFFVSLFATGTSKAVTGSAKEVNKSISSVQNIGKSPPQNDDSKSTIKYDYVSTPATNSNSSTNTKKQGSETPQEKTLDKALNTSSSNNAKKNTNYSEDESSSSIQNGNKQGGYCFIGEDRGVRTCAKVKYSSDCMSGDIFPSNEICVNPSLRP